MPSCPTCSQLLLNADQRCPRCEPAPRVRVAGDAVFDDLVERTCERQPLYAEGLQLMDRLAEIAPAVARWRQMPGAGPQPDVHPRHREEVARILKRLPEIADEIDRAKL